MMENGLYNHIKEYKGRPIKRHTSGVRWYAPEKSNQWKPSVTTIIGGTITKGIGFEKWLGNHPSYNIACQERDKAAWRGTQVHNMVEKFLNGEVVVSNYDDETEEVDDELAKHMMSFERFWKENNLTVLKTELFLWHEDVNWAGTPDIICEINGKLAVIDLKTGKEHKTHEIQLNMYAELIRKTFDIEEIEMYALYTKGKWIREPNYKMKKAKPSDIMHSVYDTWTWLNTTRSKPWPKERVQLKYRFEMNEKTNKQLMENL